MKKLILVVVIVALNPVAFSQTTVTDIDGNTYKTAVFGSQTWMTENLRTTKFNDGTPLVIGTDANWSTNFGDKEKAQYAYYDFDESTAKKYGVFYRSPNVLRHDGGEVQNICPKGWHVPSKSDWETLFDHVGGIESGGLKLGTGTKFNGVKTGYANTGKFMDSYFMRNESTTIWWSSTKAEYVKGGMGNNSSVVYSLIFNDSPTFNFVKKQDNIEVMNRGFFAGYCVRCMKD